MLVGRMVRHEVQNEFQAAPVHLGGVQRHWLSQFSDDELRTLGALLGRVAPPPIVRRTICCKIVTVKSKSEPP